MKKVIVTSTNPVKLKAVRDGFEKVFGKDMCKFETVKVDSGVPDQPMSDEETMQGAEGRVKRAKADFPEADYWVGMEAGIENTKHGMEAFGWVVVESKERIGRGCSAKFILPDKIRDLIESGVELGDADDRVFGISNSKQTNGAVGILTHDVITRATLYEPAVILALIPFVNESLY